MSAGKSPLGSAPARPSSGSATIRALPTISPGGRPARACWRRADRSTRRTGRYLRAIGLEPDPAVRRFLERRRAELGGDPVPGGCIRRADEVVGTNADARETVVAPFYPEVRVDGGHGTRPRSVAPAGFAGEMACVRMATRYVFTMRRASMLEERARSGGGRSAGQRNAMNDPGAAGISSAPLARRQQSAIYPRAKVDVGFSAGCSIVAPPKRSRG